MVGNRLEGKNSVQSVDNSVLCGNFINGRLQGEFTLNKSSSTMMFLYDESKLIQENKVRKLREPGKNQQ